VVLWAESSAIHPRISNKPFVLRPGEVAKTNFTLVGVKVADDPQTVRAIVYASPLKASLPMKVWETDAEVSRIDPSSSAWLLVPIVLGIGCAAGVSGVMVRRRPRR
jgi:hypothetical protein